MSRLLLIVLLLSGFVAQNRPFTTVVLSKKATSTFESVASPKVTKANKALTTYCNDTLELGLLSPFDTIYVRSVMETTKDPVTARYLLKTSRWGDTLAAFQNTYKAILPVPYELFMPLETAPEFPFPHANAVPFNDSIYPFKIVPFKNDQRLAGITTFDLALISRHVLGIQLFTSPFKMIAADVNKDGSVDATDMLLIRRVILRVDTMFRTTPHWVFIPKTYVMPTVIPPIDSIPQAYFFNAFTLNLPNPFEFTTIKIGDVNNSFRDTNALPTLQIARNSQNPFVLTTEDRLIEKGKTYELALNCTKTEQFIAFQGTLSLNTEGIFESVESETLNMFGEQNLNNRKKQVAFSWNDASDKVFRNNETVLKLKLKAQTDGKLSDILKMNDDLSESLVYTEGGQTRRIELRFSEPSKDFYVFQNEPNPFVGETSLKIEIKTKNDEEIPTKWSLFDENGHLLFQRSQLFKNGMHLLRLDANEMGLSKAGIYFLKVETALGTQMIKLLKIAN